jgi:hypothetical protein
MRYIAIKHVIALSNDVPRPHRKYQSEEITDNCDVGLRKYDDGTPYLSYETKNQIWIAQMSADLTCDTNLRLVCVGNAGVPRPLSHISARYRRRSQSHQ